MARKPRTTLKQHMEQLRQAERERACRIIRRVLQFEYLSEVEKVEAAILAGDEVSC